MCVELKVQDGKMFYEGKMLEIVSISVIFVLGTM